MLPPSADPITYPDEADQIEWAGGFVFESFGARIRVRVNDRQLLPKLNEILPPYATIIPTTTADAVYSVWNGMACVVGDLANLPHRLLVDGQLLIESPNLGVLLDVFESALNFAVAIHARTHLFVHAGVVGWNGEAIVIPGLSMSGKTELVAALVQAGATYYSDECAPIDEDGRVHPFPKPLYRRRLGRTLRDRCSPEMLGGRAGVEPLPVGLIVVTSYEPGADWQPRLLSRGEALAQCLEHIRLARREPARMLATLSRMVTGVDILAGTRGEAADVVPSIHGAVNRRLSRHHAEEVAPGVIGPNDRLPLCVVAS